MCSSVALLSRRRLFDGAEAGCGRCEPRGESKPSTNSNASHRHISDLFQDDRQTGTPPHHPLHHSPVSESLTFQHSSTLAYWIRYRCSQQGGRDSRRGAGTQPVSSLLRNNYRAKEGWTTCTAHPEVTGSYVWPGLRASSDVVPTQKLICRPLRYVRASPFLSIPPGDYRRTVRAGNFSGTFKLNGAHNTHLS